MNKYTLGVAIVLLVVGIYLIANSFVPLRAGKGDSYSEASVLIAGTHFVHYGFFNLKFLPVEQPDPLTDPPRYYTHYPPLPYILNGVWKKFGFQDLWQFRMISILVSLFAAYLFYLIASRLFNSLIGFLCFTYFVSSGVFLDWADSVYMYPYQDLTIYGAMLCFLIAVEKKSSGKNNGALYYFLTYVLLVGNALTSFESIVLLQVFFWGYTFFIDRTVGLRKLFIVATAPVVGLLMHFGQIVWALGWNATLGDMYRTFMYRTLDSGAMGTTQILLYPVLVVNRLERFYGLLIMPVVGIWIFYGLIRIVRLRFAFNSNINLNREREYSANIILKMGRKTAATLPRHAGTILLLFGFGSFFWYLVFFQHATIHTHPIRYYLPFFSFLFAFTVVGL